jgi:hypothetical protein
MPSLGQFKRNYEKGILIFNYAINIMKDNNNNNNIAVVSKYIVFYQRKVH